MELLYVWCDKNSLFENKGFTFCGDLKFNSRIVSDNNEETKIELSIDEVNDYLNIFPDQIHSLTALIGANGSGKSTLLNLIKSLMGNIEFMETRYIFCYRDSKFPTKIITRYFGGKTSMLNVSKYRKINLKCIKQNTESKLDISDCDLYIVNPLANKIKITENCDDFFRDTQCIYYTNVIDSTREDFFPHIFNISTNHLLAEKNNEFFKTYSDEGNELNTNVFNQRNPIIDFHKDELHRQIQYIVFAKQNKIKKLPKTPAELIIYINNNDYIFLINDPNYSYGVGLSDDKSALKKFHEKSFKEIQEITDMKERFKSVIYLLTFYYTIRYDLFKQPSVPLDVINTFIAQDRSIGNIESIKNFFDSINMGKNETSRTYKFNNIKRIYSSEFDKALHNAQIFTQEFDLINTMFSFSFHVDENLWDLLNLIFNIRFFEDTTFFDFYLTEKISAGEAAFLSQFARFLSIKNNLDSDLLILIDEGDLYFHPEWQREYLTNLFEFFATAFKHHKIQLILTSHSPFIVSDIPKSNVIFLPDSNIGLKETFGSNIHTLYTNSFFMQGLISSYAKSKIDSAIDYLNGEKVAEWSSVDDEKIQKFIRLIGEPLLRNQLQKMLDSKKISDTNRKVNHLETRLSKLENKRK